MVLNPVAAGQHRSRRYADRTNIQVEGLVTLPAPEVMVVAPIRGLVPRLLTR